MLVDPLTLRRNINESKKEKQTKPESRFFSDILVNESEDSEWRKGLKVLDYTKNPKKLLEDMNSFAEDKHTLIKICGKVAGFDVNISGNYNDRKMYYEGMIILDNDIPIYFIGHRSQEEVPNLKLEKIILESAKSFPITITGRIFSGGINCRNRKFQYYFEPCVFEMGNYISPQPKAEEKEK